MKLDFTNTLYALSFALDAVEHEHNGALEGHGKRVAWMSERMGKEAGIKGAALIDLAGVAILHDNALIEFQSESEGNGFSEYSGGLEGHCQKGEQRIHLLPFETDVSNAVLYHHECADGSGPFGKKSSETPMIAQIIHLADTIDVIFKLPVFTEDNTGKLVEFVHQQKGSLFSSEVIELFDKAFSIDALREFETKGIDQCLRDDLPTQMEEVSREAINGITRFFSEIIDFKSSFTRAHSMGVARRAEEMARHYGWDEEKVDRYYFAGALHDIGKMIITNDILEKPGKLTGSEFSIMQNHASATYRVLHQIAGMEDITEWASNHHEKLDGKGYPRGLNAEQLSFEERLMACIDNYQALTEDRPYKAGLSHRKTISIMQDMVAQGKIDGSIVDDLDRFYGGRADEEKSEQPAEQALKKWRCPTCGYVYSGDTPPERCPVCDMPGSNYVALDQGFH